MYEGLGEQRLNEYYKSMKEIVQKHKEQRKKD
jgi:hypothetical protein